MSLVITGTARENGANCNHLIVTINHEGVTRTFKTTMEEIDAVPMTAEDMKDFIIRGAKYRRMNGRSILNVDIA